MDRQSRPANLGGLVLRLVQSARVWLLLSTLITRGAGFLTSLLISRLIGAEALGTYSALVNTASSAAPFAQAIANNATILAATGERIGASRYRALARANLLVAGLLSAVSIGIFLFLYRYILGHSEVHDLLVLLAGGSSVIVGQLLSAVSLGFLHGVGEFVFASRLAVFVASAVTLAVYPTVSRYGLYGALGLLVISSLTPPLFWTARVLLRGDTSQASPGQRLPPLREVSSRLVRALPSVLASSINNGVNWICTIYLAQTWFGAEGVGVVSVAIQWQTLMVLPATSWGGVSLKLLTDAVATRDIVAVRRTTFTLVRKNFLVTLFLAGLIGLASRFIADVYGLGGTGIALLICINGACALVASINNVFERLLLALDRQSWWLAFSLGGFTAQLAMTWTFIAKGLWIIALGVLLAGSILCLLCLVTMNRAIATQMKKKA